MLKAVMSLFEGSTSPLGVSSGGTGNTSYTTNGVVYYDGTKLTSGTPLTWNGSTFTITSAASTSATFKNTSNATTAPVAAGAFNLIITNTDSTNNNYQTIGIIDSGGFLKGYLRWNNTNHTDASATFALSVSGNELFTSTAGGSMQCLNGLLAQRVTVTASTLPANGIYLPTTNVVGFATNTTMAGGIDANQNWGIGTTSPTAKLNITGNVTTTSWTTLGKGFGLDSITYTDNSGSGTIAGPRVSFSIAQPTFASGSVETLTDAATFYIANKPAAGSNTTITTGWASYVAAGDCYFGGNIKISQNTTGAGTALLSTNCPAVTVSAPYTWVKLISSDGSTVYVPAWK